MISKKQIINLMIKLLSYIKNIKTVISYRYNKYNETSLFYSVLNGAIVMNNVLGESCARFHHSQSIFIHWSLKSLCDKQTLVMSLYSLENYGEKFPTKWKGKAILIDTKLFPKEHEHVSAA